MSNLNFKFHQLFDEFKYEKYETKKNLSFEEAFKINFPMGSISNNENYEEINYNSLYFKNKSDKNPISSTKETTAVKEKNDEKIKLAKPIFKIHKEEDKNLEKKRNLGRKKKSEKVETNENSSAKQKKTHDKNYLDNILNRVQIDCHNSIPECANSFLDFFGHDKNERFLNIQAAYKKMVNKAYLDRIKKTKLHKILCLKISEKYSNYPLDHNQKLYEKLKKRAEKEPIYQTLINFLEEDYLFYFQNVYYKNKRTINLHKYGIDALLPLSEKVKTFNDKFESFKDEEPNYLNNVKKCINLVYFDSKLIMFQLEDHFYT